MPSITQQFLVAVSMVSARKAWHNDPLLCPQHNKKRVQITRLADYTSETNYNNMPETQNPLAKTFFVMLNSRNEWQGLFQVVVNEEWNSLFLSLEIFLKVLSLICVSIVIAAGEKLNQHAM